MASQLLAWPRRGRRGCPQAPSALLLKAFSPLMGDTGGSKGVVADKLGECGVLSPAVDAAQVAAAAAAAAVAAAAAAEAAAAAAAAPAVAAAATAAAAPAVAAAVAAAVAVAVAVAAAVMVAAPLLLLPMAREVLRDFLWVL